MTLWGNVQLFCNIVYSSLNLFSNTDSILSRSMAKRLHVFARDVSNCLFCGICRPVKHSRIYFLSALYRHEPVSLRCLWHTSNDWPNVEMDFYPCIHLIKRITLPAPFSSALSVRPRGFCTRGRCRTPGISGRGPCRRSGRGG